MSYAMLFSTVTAAGFAQKSVPSCNCLCINNLANGFFSQLCCGMFPRQFASCLAAVGAAASAAVGNSMFDPLGSLLHRQHVKLHIMKRHWHVLPMWRRFGWWVQHGFEIQVQQIWNPMPSIPWIQSDISPLERTYDCTVYLLRTMCR